MELKFVTKLFSIGFFESIELPKMTVLTGLNGTGKSQLLQGLRFNHFTLGNIKQEQIVFFDSNMFGIDNEPPVTKMMLQDERKNIYLSIRDQLTRLNLTNHLVGYTDKLSGLSQRNKCSFYKLSSDVLFSNGLKDIIPRYDQFVRQTLEVVNNLHTGTNPHIVKPVLQRLLDQINKPVEFLTRDEFDQYYVPVSYKNNFLINNLGKIFSDYWEKWELNSYNKFRIDQYQESHIVYTEDKFFETFGEKPWDTINNIIKRFGNLEYKINSPEGLERGHDFQLKLISTKDSNTLIDFDGLSSGERIMMGLVATLYTTKMDNKFPKLILLDEIDASLHPSMSKIMLEILQDELVAKKNLNVILVTHSPSTVALAPENSVYIMSREDLNRIVKSTNKEALHILSEGFASLTLSESNLQVNYNISKASDFVLLTEGITDRIIIDAAWKSVEKRQPNFDIQDCFDASFLRNIFARGDIFLNYPLKTFIAVFDFDTAGYNSWNNLPDFQIIESDPKKGLLKKHQTKQAYALLLPVPDGIIEKQVIKNKDKTFQENAHMPIELLFYNVDSVKDNYKDEIQVGGGVLKKFVGNKAKFADNISTNFKEPDFLTMKPLMETIKRIFQ